MATQSGGGAPQKIERTLVIIKPDSVEDGLTEEFKDKYVQKGLKITFERSGRFKLEQAKEFYSEHAGKSFFTGLALFMSSGVSVFLVIEGENAINRVRIVNNGTLDPGKALPGSIRADFPSAGGPCNRVHGSDSPQAFASEFNIVNRLLRVNATSS